jgi:hypothetical protein
MATNHFGTATAAVHFGVVESGQNLAFPHKSREPFGVSRE